MNKAGLDGATRKEHAHGTWNMGLEEHVDTCSFYMMSMYYEHVEHTEGTCQTYQRNTSNMSQGHVGHVIDHI